MDNILTETVLGGSAGASFNKVSYSYDIYNRLTAVKEGNSTVANYTYDKNNQLTSSTLLVMKKVLV